MVKGKKIKLFVRNGKNGKREENKVVCEKNYKYSNITKCELFREDTSNTKSNPSIKQKE